MKINDEKHLLFLHILDAMKVQGNAQECFLVDRIRAEFENMFSMELNYARTRNTAEFDEDVRNVRDALYQACKKHPLFANSPEQGVCILLEEVGELAQEVNDNSLDYQWKSRAYEEAAQVAAVAIRFMRKIR